jgi:hypothetical protein
MTFKPDHAKVSAGRPTIRFDKSNFFSCQTADLASLVALGYQVAIGRIKRGISPKYSYLQPFLPRKRRPALRETVLGPTRPGSRLTKNIFGHSLRDGASLSEGGAEEVSNEKVFPSHVSMRQRSRVPVPFATTRSLVPTAQEAPLAGGHGQLRVHLRMLVHAVCGNRTGSTSAPSADRSLPPCRWPQCNHARLAIDDVECSLGGSTWLDARVAQAKGTARRFAPAGRVTRHPPQGPVWYRLGTKW